MRLLESAAVFITRCPMKTVWQGECRPKDTSCIVETRKPGSLTPTPIAVCRSNRHTCGSLWSQNASTPVISRPRANWWMVSVPSYVITLSRFNMWRTGPHSTLIPPAPSGTERLSLYLDLPYMLSGLPGCPVHGAGLGPREPVRGTAKETRVA